MTLIKTFFITILVLLALGMLIFYFFQRQLIYFPDKSRPSFAPAKGLGFENIILHTQDGLQLNAWYHPAKENYPTIIHFHGNAGNISARLYLAHQLTNLGYGIMLLDYRGYGGNPGSPSESGFYLDAEAALTFLQSKKIPKNKWVIFGESIGSGVAVEMAKRHMACALILQSPFQSLPATIRYHHPWLFIPPTDKFDSITKIGQITMPVLIIHGKQDMIVPYNHAKALFEKIGSPKQFISYPLGTHLNLWHPDFFSQIDRFLQKHCFNP